MASSIITRLNSALQKFQQLIGHYLNSKFPPSALAIVDIPQFENNAPVINKFDLDSLKNGFLFAVPTHKRTLEKRLKRKFGWPKYVWKPFVPKTNILTCLNCGHHKLSDTLCPNCYNTVKTETLKLQEEIQNNLGIQPVEKEVVILYQGEANDNYWKNQTIVEIPRKRPDWFTSNLMQTTSEKEENQDAVKNSSAKISDL